VRKREAVVAAARAVVGRSGYAAASIDAIAAEAGVSTRTIYNHFPGKEQLVAAAVAESAARVADELIAAVDDLLDAARPVDEALLGVVRAWVAVRRRHVEHVALVRMLGAESAAVPVAVLDAWRDSGPRRAERALARYLAWTADRGVLRIEEPVLAAEHLLLLTVGMVEARTVPAARPLSAAELDALLRAGVRAFLHGHLA
jgi:AcrR family transcriptional regulator